MDVKVYALLKMLNIMVANISGFTVPQTQRHTYDLLLHHNHKVTEHQQKQWGNLTVEPVVEAATQALCLLGHTHS